MVVADPSQKRTRRLYEALQVPEGDAVTVSTTGGVGARRDGLLFIWRAGKERCMRHGTRLTTMVEGDNRGRRREGRRLAARFGP